VSLRLYMDVHVPRAVTIALRHRGIDCLTAQEDGAGQIEDSAMLDRAGSLGRVLVTQDQDFLTEGATRQARGIFFAGIVYAAQQHVSIGRMIADLEILAKASDPSDMENRVVYLPL
jgi:Domain of unknown function (DUF5615)